MKFLIPILISILYSNVIFSQEKDIEIIQDLILQQLEKFVFWNDLFSLTDRHSGKRDVDELFNIFPLFFVYQVILKLSEFGYNDFYLTKFEINNFLIFSTKHSDINQVVNNIIKYRSYNEIYELEKFLKINNRMDSRFYSVLKYSKYFLFNTKKIAIKKEMINDLTNKVKNFEILFRNNKIIFFDKENVSIYKKLLTTNKSLINYLKTL